MIAALFGIFLGCQSAADAVPQAGSDDLTLQMPTELATPASLALFGDWNSQPTLRDGIYRLLSTRDREQAVVAGPDLLRNGNKDMNNFVCQGQGEAMLLPVVPLAFDQLHCDDAYLRGYVVADVTGPGRLARLAYTSTSLLLDSLDERTNLLLYLDDSTTPALRAPMRQALAGTAGRFFQPPFAAAVSTNLAWYYPVDFAQRLVVAIENPSPADLIYFQIGYVTSETPLAAPAGDPAAAAVATLNDRNWLQALDQPVAITLPPGETVTLERQGPAVLSQLRITLASNRVADLATVRLRVFWDEYKKPAVNAPLDYIYGTFFAVPPLAGLVLGATAAEQNTTLAMRLPMPYRHVARFEFANSGTMAIEFAVDLPQGVQMPSEPWGYLHAVTNETAAPASTPGHHVANFTGRGRLMGTCLHMLGRAMADTSLLNSSLNFLEGDELIQVDGEPRLFGTGTEDYFNSSFYFQDAPFATPFAQAWAVVPPPNDVVYTGLGQVSACRWHVLGDSIDFAENLNFDLEIGPGQPRLLERYRSTAWAYLLAGE